MNVEFLEKYLVISSKTTGEGAGATTTYSVPKVRKNLAPISFVGAIVATDDELEAYPVESAVKASAAATTIAIVAGPFTLTYTIATGEFTVAKE
jgi:hypothetical protein